MTILATSFFFVACVYALCTQKNIETKQKVLLAL